MPLTCNDNDNQIANCHQLDDDEVVVTDKLACLKLQPKTNKDIITEDNQNNGKEDEASDSGHSEVPNIPTKSQPLRIHKSNSISGILKYPPGWKRRTYSEGSALSLDRTLSNDCGYFEETVFQDDCDDDDGTEKPKKCVTFSRKNAVFVFRPNSSILGRRLKNQKKAKKRKERMLREGSLSSPGSDPGDHMGEHFNYDSSCSSCESSAEFSGSSGCESSGDEMSGTEMLEAPSEFKVNQVCESKADAKGKRKDRRKRNRKSKQSLKTNLEIGGYDSE